MIKRSRTVGINCYGMSSFTHWTRGSVPFSKFKDIEGQLRLISEKPGLRRFAEHAQDDEEISGLLEGLQEAISDYQVSP